jgi:hypothetical protein
LKSSEGNQHTKRKYGLCPRCESHLLDEDGICGSCGYRFVVVDQIREIEKIGVEEACERIVAWLTKRGGKVDDKRSKKPNFIWANHGSHWTVCGWKKNAKKVMQFYLTPMESGVHVRVTIEPTSINTQDVIHFWTDAERNWTELADEFWLEFTANALCNKRVNQ